MCVKDHFLAWELPDKIGELFHMLFCEPIWDVGRIKEWSSKKGAKPRCSKDHKCEPMCMYPVEKSMSRGLANPKWLFGGWAFFVG